MKVAVQRAFAIAAIALGVLAISIPLFACEWPLTPASIREAYQLGRRKDVKTALFLKRYTLHFPRPIKGPHVATIQLETPYMLVVKRSGESPNYDIQDAEKEFLGSAAVVRFIVRIDFTETYSRSVAVDGEAHPRPADFWRDFKIRVVQGAEIEPASVRGQQQNPGGADGVNVVIEFEGGKIRCAPATVDVVTPDGQHIEAPFELAKLK
jgi:hypothetical protein